MVDSPYRSPGAADEAWTVLLATDDPAAAAELASLVEAAGIPIRARVAVNLDISPDVPAHEVLVPAERREQAEGIVDAAMAVRAADAAASIHRIAHTLLIVGIVAALLLVGAIAWVLVLG